MEQESLKPDFILELPKEALTKSNKELTKERDLPTSESATILINSMNNSRMLNNQKVINRPITSYQSSNQSNSQSNQQANKSSASEQSAKKTQSTNQTNDGDIMKFEDELDVQPHSFDIASRLIANSSKIEATVKDAKTSKPDESNGKKLTKKHHLHIFQMKKKLKNNPERFKAIKIRAPRLHLSNSTAKLIADKQARRHKIGYASLVRTRNVNLTDYHSDDRLFIKVRSFFF